MDKKLVAKSQPYEAYYIAGRFKIPLRDVKAAMKKAGRSRKKVYAELRGIGYTISTKAIRSYDKKYKR